MLAFTAGLLRGWAGGAAIGAGAVPLVSPCGMFWAGMRDCGPTPTLGGARRSTLAEGGATPRDVPGRSQPLHWYSCVSGPYWVIVVTGRLATTVRFSVVGTMRVRSTTFVTVSQTSLRTRFVWRSSNSS